MKLALALKRSSRGSAPEDWASVLHEIRGLTVISGDGTDYLVVDVHQDAIIQLYKQLSKICHIEPIIRHEQRGSDNSADLEISDHEIPPSKEP